MKTTSSLVGYPIMQSTPNKFLTFMAFIVGVGLLYPLILSGIFKFDLKTSLTVGPIFGVVGGVLWLATSNIRERRRASKNSRNAT